jgi:hypothetical protein
MSLLDIFTIMFKADTADLEKGQKSALKSTNDLADRIRNTISDVQDLGASFLAMADQAASAFSSIATPSLGFGSETTNYKNGKETEGGEGDKASLSLIEIGKKGLAATGIVFGLGETIKSVLNSSEYVIGIDRFSKAIGVNTQEMEIWDRGYKNIVGEGKSLMPVIENITNSLNKSKQFGGLGTLPADNILSKLRAAGPFSVDITGSDHGMATSFQLLLRMSAKMDEMRAKGADQSQVASFAKTWWGLDDDTILFLSQGLTQVTSQLEDIKKRGVPDQKSIDNLREFTRQWGIIKQTMVNVSVAITGALAPTLGFLFGHVKKSSEGLWALKKALEIVGLTMILSAEIIFPAFTAGLYAMAGGFFAALIPFWPFIAAIGVLWALLRYGPVILKAVENAFFYTFDHIKHWIMEAINLVREFLGLKALAEKPSLHGDSRKGKNQLDKDAAAIAAAHHAVSMAATSRIGAQVNTPANSMRLNTVSVGNITVHTQATDAQGIAASIGDVLKKHINIATMTLGNDGQLA